MKMFILVMGADKVEKIFYMKCVRKMTAERWEKIIIYFC
jgi:hypothetical protein